ncbi:hypothetical protein [Polaromonas sp. CF318]
MTETRSTCPCCGVGCDLTAYAVDRFAMHDKGRSLGLVHHG